MVRTRSGKATTTEEKKEVQKSQIEKKMKSPKAAPKALKQQKSPQVNHVTFDRNVNDQPGKSYLKSPSIKSSGNKSFSFPSSNSSWWSTFKSGWKQSPFFFTTSFVALSISIFTAWTVWVELKGVTSTLLQFLFLVLAIHQVDIGANLMNRILDGDMNSDSAYFFTESALNLSEVMLFLYTINTVGSTSVVGIALVVTFMFPACWLNVRFRDEDKLWVRIMAYIVLMGTLAVNWEGIMENERLLCYSGLVVCAMTADILDLPDNYTQFEWCDGLVMMLRSVACYSLITHELLKNTYSNSTVQESQMMRLFGF